MPKEVVFEVASQPQAAKKEVEFKAEAEPPKIWITPWGWPAPAGNIVERFIGAGQGSVLRILGSLSAPLEAASGGSFDVVRKTTSEAAKLFPQPKPVEKIDWTDPADVGGWAAELMGSQLPNVGITGLGGLVGGVPGLVAASGALNIGESYSNLRELGVENTKATALGLGAGAAKTALDVLTPLRAAKAVAPAARQGLKQLAKELFRESGMETVLEGGQEALDIAAEHVAGVGQPGAVSRIINAAVAGGLTAIGFAPFSLARSMEPPKELRPPTEPLEPPAQLVVEQPETGPTEPPKPPEASPRMPEPPPAEPPLAASEAPPKPQPARKGKQAKDVEATKQMILDWLYEVDPTKQKQPFYVGDVRKALDLPKELFDQAVAELNREGLTYSAPHDHPMRLSEAEREELVKAGDQYLVSLSDRRPPRDPRNESTLNRLLNLRIEEPVDAATLKSMLQIPEAYPVDPLIDTGLLKKVDNGYVATRIDPMFEPRVENHRLILRVAGREFAPYRRSSGQFVATVEGKTFEAPHMEALLDQIKAWAEQRGSVAGQVNEGPLEPEPPKPEPKFAPLHFQAVEETPIDFEALDGSQRQYVSDMIAWSAVDIQTAKPTGIRREPVEVLYEGEEATVSIGRPIEGTPPRNELPVAVLRDGVFAGWQSVPVEWQRYIGARIPQAMVVDFPVEAFDNQLNLRDDYRAALPSLFAQHVAPRLEQDAKAYNEQLWGRIIALAPGGATRKALGKTTVPLLDMAGIFTKAFRARKDADSLAARLVDVYSRAMAQLRASQAMLQSEELQKTLGSITHLGILIGSDRDGLVLENPAKPGKYIVFINPFSPAAAAGTADGAAMKVVQTLIHEMAHLLEPLHVNPENPDAFVNAMSTVSTMMGDALSAIHQEFARGYTSEIVKDDEGTTYRRIDRSMVEIAQYLEQLEGSKGTDDELRLLQESRSRGIGAQRIAERIDKENDPVRLGKLWQDLRERLERHPDDVVEALKGERVVRSVEAAKQQLGDSVLLYRNEAPTTGQNFVEMYVRREAAEGRIPPGYVLPEVENFTPPDTGVMHFRFGTRLYRLFHNVTTGLWELRSGHRLLAEAPWQEIIDRLKQERDSIRKMLEERAARVKPVWIRKDQLEFIDSELAVARMTPEIREQLELEPSLRFASAAPRANIPGHAEALKKLVDLGKAGQWPEWSIKQGLHDFSRAVVYSRKLMTLLQLSYSFPKWEALQNYVSTVREFWKTKISTLVEPHNILEDWIKLGHRRAGIVGRAAQEITERSWREGRRLRDEEVLETVKKHGGGQQEFDLWRRIDEAFRQAGEQMINALKTEAVRIYGKDVSRKILLEYDQALDVIRNRNYFPLTRFGRYAVMVKRGSEVIRFESYMRRSQAERRARQLRKEEPDAQVIERYLSDNEASVLQFPPGLASYLADHLELTTEQRGLLKEIQYRLAPGRTVVKHYLHRNLVPGADKDALAAFAEYFMHFSNHLARLQHRRDMDFHVAAMRKQALALPSSYDVGKVVEMVERHLHDLMNPSSDMAWLRAGIFTYMFAWLPSMAVVNLLQVPTYTFPYLAKQLKSGAKAAAILAKAAKDLVLSFASGPSGHLSMLERDLLDRAYHEGFIEESFATNVGQLGSKSWMGSFYERAPYISFYLQRLGSYSLSMFHSAEVANRKVTFLAAVRAAQEMGIGGMDAIYDFARRAVDITQAEYSAWNRPEWARGGKGLEKLRPLAWVFKMFLQNHLYFAFTNQGGWRFWFMLLGLNGLLGGVPFAQDIKNLLELLGTFLKKMLGLPNPKVDLEVQARKAARAIGVNPDIFVYGFSTHSFGLPYVAGLFGLPFPLFDLSNSLAMQEVLPFIEPLKRTLLGEIRPKEAILDALVRTAGAVFSTGLGAGSSLISLLRGDVSPSARFAPRFLQYWLRALQSLNHGAYLSTTGEPLVKLDAKDPAQAAELFFYSLGFPPTRMTQATRLDVTMRGHMAYYMAWKESIIRDFALAAAAKDEKAKRAAIDELRQFQKTAPPPFRFKHGDFSEAVKERLKGRKLREFGLPPQKRFIPLARELAPLYSSTPTQ